MPGELKEFPQVPTLGQALEHVAFIVSDVINCRCPDGTVTVVVIPGIQGVGTCGHCGREFMIGGFHFDRASGKPPAVGINVVIRTPGSKLQ